MRMTARPSDKILRGVTGKEGVQLLAANYIEMLQGKEPPLTTADLDAMIAGLERRPHEAQSYNEWCRAVGALLFYGGETRVLAMKAAFKVGVLVAMMNHRFLKECVADSVEEKEKTDDMAKEMAAYAQATLNDLARLHLLLEAFGDVLQCYIPCIAAQEMDMLKASVTLYNDMVVPGLEAVGCNLPRLSLTPENMPANLKDQLIAAIEKAPGTSFLGVVDVLDRKLGCL